MKITARNIFSYAATVALTALPFVAFGADSDSSRGMETAITLGYYLSSIGFLLATIIIYMAVSRFGKSSLGSIFSFLLIGTGIFFIITVFQKLGGGFFGIEAESMDIWWHLMFYMAFFFYFHGFKLLNSLGNDEAQSSSNVQIGSEKRWGILALILLVIIFIIPHWADPLVAGYSASHLSELGLHHFLAFLLSGLVASYLFTARKNLGQIGKAIANPMIIAMLAFTAQHFWELLYESWKVVEVTSFLGEGIEKIFLIIAAGSIGYAALRLKSFARE